MTCIREHLTLEEAGRILETNAERHLKLPEEMARLFRHGQKRSEKRSAFSNRCNFSLEELRKTEYADETRQGYATPQEALVAFAKRDPKTFPRWRDPEIRQALDEELRLIGKFELRAVFSHSG